MKVVQAGRIADGRIYAEYVEWRAANPSDDLMTALLNVEFTDELGITRKLHRKEVLHYTQVVAGAGNETTGRPIGWLAKDFEYHGSTIPAGSAMLLLFGAANRDPRRYRNPGTFDIHRATFSHLTFGKGLHYCLGANLARLEGRVALDELLNRFPEWEIDYDSAQLAPTSTVRGWEKLRIVVP
jgi:cytochrome P450